MLQRPMKVTWLRWFFIWRDHLCPPVVLCGNGLITFLTCRVPAQSNDKTHIISRSHNMHVGVLQLWEKMTRKQLNLPYLHSHLDSIYFKCFHFKIDPYQRKKEENCILFHRKQLQHNTKRAICLQTPAQTHKVKLESLKQLWQTGEKSCFVGFWVCLWALNECCSETPLSLMNSISGAA